jgi:hypothetical protein
MLVSNFSDRDKGWKKFCTNFKVQSGETSGFVGYLRSSGDYKNEEQKKADGTLNDSEGNKNPPTPITMAQLASVHEFGSADGTIPERSFMRSAIDKHSKELKRLTHKAAYNASMGHVTKKQALGLICQKMTGWFQDEIEAGVPPPNKPATIARKGSSKTLIDTGQLKNSIDWEIKTGKK